MLPSTSFLSLSLYAGNMHLALSLAFLGVAARALKSGVERWVWPAALLVGGVMLTRTAGVALLPAFATVLWRVRPRRWPAMLLVAIVPAVLWSALHDSQNNYSNSFAELYAGAGLSEVVRMLQYQAVAAMIGLASNVTSAPGLSVLVLVMWAVAAIVAGQRLIRGQPDAVYVGCYLALLVLWPFPAQATRLTWMVVPLLLGYLGLAADAVARRLALPGAVKWAPIGLLLPMALAAFAFTASRAAEARKSDHPEVAAYPHWYGTGERAKERGLFDAEIVAGIVALAPRVPEGDCIVSVRAPLVAYHGRRMSFSPPVETRPDGEFQQWLEARGCRHFLLFPLTGPLRSTLFYPYKRLADRVDLVDAYHPDDSGRTPVVLARLRATPR
jgi:hypothetical protein